MRITIPLVLLSVLTTSASAQVTDVMVSSRFGTAERLVASCRKVANLDIGNMAAPSKEHYEIGLCSGFIIGVVDAETYSAEVFRALGQRDLSPQSFRLLTAQTECLPSTVTVTQLAKVIVKYGDEHPNELHTAAVDFLHGALMSAFPCK